MSDRALFLDRDGTLIVDRGYLADPAGVELLPGTTDALRRARALGYRFFLFTNQSGVSRGYHTLADVHRVNARMEELIGLPPPLFDGIGIAPEAPDQPVVYRKPSPRFISETLTAHRLDPARCWMVGDSPADLGAGLAAGTPVALVRTGRLNPDSYPEVSAHRIPVFDRLADFIATLA